MARTFPVLDKRLLAGLAPLAERARSIDAGVDLRLRAGNGRLSAFVRLPFDVLAGCTVPMQGAPDFDVTVSAEDFLGWTDHATAAPARRDASWLSALPPQQGWRRVETIPAAVVHELVRSGAVLAPGAASRADQRNLLGTTVITAGDGDTSIEVPLGVLSALTRMGFLPPDGAAAIDVAPGWLRVAAAFGSAYQHRAGTAAGVLRWIG